MCGIAGLVGEVERSASIETVRHMMGALARRGPDGEGLEAWPSAVLGHRRLAIFDLSDAGRQPMLSPERDIGVVFNGALYNFRDLRAALESYGHRFRSQTDTEVLVHGYRQWGIDGLVARLRGMFAFGLWDDRHERLFLVRDRLGVKPLAYVARNGQLAFASTMRALHATGLVDALDAEAIAEYLESGYVPDERAIYRGVAKVPAASIVEWSGDGLRVRRYWSQPIPGTASDVSFEEAVERTESLLLQAVSRRLQADVPVAALLSGGIDSSLVCWAIRQLGANVTAFTVGTPGDLLDEANAARTTARRLGIPHQILEMHAADSPSLDELVTAYAEPFACASALGMLGVARMVAPSATVLLTGDGGDDVFLGYPHHRHLLLAEWVAKRLPAPMARGWEVCGKLVPKIGPLRRAASFMNYATGGLGAYTAGTDAWPFYQRHRLLGEQLAGVRIPHLSIPWSREAGRTVLADTWPYNLRRRFVGEFMTKVDGATMHYALEARSPFFDQDLWEFAAALPFDLRLRRGRLKAVLRELARRRIDSRVARGQKRYFNIPVQRWLVGPWKAAFEAVLRDSLLERRGWIHSAPALALLDRATTLGRAPNELWHLFVLELWLRYEEATRGATLATAG
jgi:asparagine synthase (glutamine-hydrolysing)